MSEAEVITACENVCRDFNWLLNWLVQVAANPVWALFFGFWISLFIWRRQTKLSAELDLNRERRSLFRDYISQSGKAILAKDTDPGTPWHLHPEIRRIWALQAEISLISSKTTDEKTRLVLKALEYRFENPDSQFVCSDGMERDSDESVRFELERAIEHMKTDLAKN